jgi:hypothetical protein
VASVSGRVSKNVETRVTASNSDSTTVDLPYTPITDMP